MIILCQCNSGLINLNACPALPFIDLLICCTDNTIDSDIDTRINTDDIIDIDIHTHINTDMDILIDLLSSPLILFLFLFLFLFLRYYRWLGFRLDVESSIVLICVVFVAVSLRDTVDVGLIGFTIVYTLSLSGLLQWTVRQVL